MIIRYSKIHFFNKFEIFWYFSETTANIKTCKFTVFFSGSFCQIYRVTDEALIAETMVWPNFFLMNVFYALKGSKPFIIISYIYGFLMGKQLTVNPPPDFFLIFV